MKKIALLAVSTCLLWPAPEALAQQGADYTQGLVSQQDSVQKQVDPVQKQISYLQKEWARIKYQVSGKDSKLEAIHKLEEHAAKVSARYPDRADVLIWEGIILSTDAGIVKGMSALGKVKTAKALFERALQIDPEALSGSAYASLGSLYYQVPGWPVAFGDNDKAEEYLKKALSFNPSGIDPNYFYGDFLLRRHKYEEAQRYFERALQAPDRPERPLADAGRRQEVKAALAQIEQKLNDKAKKRYN